MDPKGRGYAALIVRYVGHYVMGTRQRMCYFSGNGHGIQKVKTESLTTIRPRQRESDYA